MTFVDGARLGVARFAPLRSEVGSVVPVAFGTLAWTFRDVDAAGKAIAGQERSGVSVILKATFSLASSPMKVLDPDPLVAKERKDESGSVVAPCDLVPRKAMIDVVVTGTARARTADVRLGILQRGTTILDVRRMAAPGEPSGLCPMVSTTAVRILPDASGGPSLILPSNVPADVFQSATSDQRTKELDPDARIACAGLFHGRPGLDVQLPSARAVGVMFGADPTNPGQPVVLQFRSDTLVLDPDRMRLSVVWRAEVPLSHAVPIEALVVGAGVATHEYPLRMRRRLEELEIEPAPARPAVAQPGRIAPREATVAMTDDAPATVALPLPIPAAQPAAAARKPAVDIRAWAQQTTKAPPREETVLTAPDPSADKAAPVLPFKGDKPPSNADKLRAWSSAVVSKGDADKTELGAGSAPPSTPFRKDAPVVAPAAVPPKSGSDRGGTVIGAERSGDRTVPFTTDKDREEALRLAAEMKQKLEEERVAQDARKAAEAKRREDAKAAEARREADRKTFEEEQARLKKVEAERKELAAQQARESAKRDQEALYGGFAKKKKR